MKFGECFITYKAFKHCKRNGFDIVIMLWFLKTIVKVLDYFPKWLLQIYTSMLLFKSPLTLFKVANPMCPLTLSDYFCSTKAPVLCFLKDININFCLKKAY